MRSEVATETVGRDRLMCLLGDSRKEPGPQFECRRAVEDLTQQPDFGRRQGEEDILREVVAGPEPDVVPRTSSRSAQSITCCAASSPARKRSSTATTSPGRSTTSGASQSKG